MTMRAVKVALVEEEEVIVYTPLSKDLDGATVYCTVKSLRDKNWPLLAVAWLKNVKTVFIQIFIVVTVHLHINVPAAQNFRPPLGLDTWEHRLQEVVPYLRAEPNNYTNHLNAANDLDANLIGFCTNLPTGSVLWVSWFLWTLTCLSEIVKNWEFITMVLNAVVIDKLGEALEDDTTTILGLSRRLKGVFIGLLAIPKFFISLSLWWAGVEFLGYSTNMSTIVLKVVALKFVLALDELIYGAFSSKALKSEMADAKICDKKHLCPGWLSELLRFLIVLTLCVTIGLWFEDIMTLRSLCGRCVYDCALVCSTSWDVCSLD